MELVWKFWYREAPDVWYGSRVFRRQVGSYAVYTWHNADGRLICTGWFK